MNTDINSFVQALDGLSSSLKYSVLLPSTQKQLTFKQLNTYQFNKIITSTKSTTKILTDILQENLVEQDVLIKNINIFDFAHILLLTKKHCIVDEIQLLFTDEEIEEYNLEDTYKQTITEFLELKKNILPIPPLTCQSDDITVVCSLPTVEREIETRIPDNVDVESEKYIEELFLMSVVKYINTINIQNTNSIIFDNIDLQSRVAILQRLPANTIKTIINTIEKLKTPITDFLTIDIKNPDGLIFTKEISLSREFFGF